MPIGAHGLIGGTVLRGQRSALIVGSQTDSDDTALQFCLQATPVQEQALPKLVQFGTFKALPDRGNPYQLLARAGGLQKSYGSK